MNKTLHIIRKDIRFNRWALLLWLAAVITHFTLRCIQINDPSWGGRTLATSSRWDHLLLFALPLIIIPFIMQADAVQRRYAFWKSLPISKTRLLLAKAILVISSFVLLPLLFEITYYYLAGLETVFWNSLKIWLFLHVPLVAIAYLLCYLTPGWKSYFCLMLPAAAVGINYYTYVIQRHPQEATNFKHASLLNYKKNIEPPVNSKFEINEKKSTIEVSYQVKELEQFPHRKIITTRIEPQLRASIRNFPEEISISSMNVSLDIMAEDRILHEIYDVNYFLRNSNEQDSELTYYNGSNILTLRNQGDREGVLEISMEPLGTDLTYEDIPEEGLTIQGKLSCLISKRIIIKEFPLNPGGKLIHGLHSFTVRGEDHSKNTLSFRVNSTLKTITSDLDLLNPNSPFPANGLLQLFLEHKSGAHKIPLSYFESATCFNNTGCRIKDISRHLKLAEFNKCTEIDDYQNSEIGVMSKLRFMDEDNDPEDWKLTIVTYEPMGVVVYPINVTLPKPSDKDRPKIALDELTIELSKQQQLRELTYKDAKTTLQDMERILINTSASEVATNEFLIFPLLSRIFSDDPAALIEGINQYASLTARPVDSYNDYRFIWKDYNSDMKPFWQRVNRFLTTSVTEQQKDLILNNLHPFVDQLDLLERMGWEKDAAPMLAKIFQQERMPQHWAYIFDRFPSDEAEAALLKQIYFRSRFLSRILQWIESIPDAKRKKQAVAQIWETTVIHCQSEPSLRLPLLIALKHGIEVAPRDIRRLVESNGFGQSQDQTEQSREMLGIYQSLALFSDCPADLIKGHEWLLLYGNKLTWNETKQRFEINLSGDALKDPYDEAKWGKRVNPIGVGTFLPIPENQAMSVTASAYAVNYTSSFLDRYCPRTMQQMTGDFTAEVTIAPLFRASPAWSGSNADIFQSAGLLLEAGQTNHLRVEATIQGNDLQHRIRQCISRASKQTYYNVENKDYDAEKPTTLRISRHGSEFFIAWKQEGGEWHESNAHLCGNWPETVSVGVYVANQCVKPFTAVFSSYQITKASNPPTKSGTPNKPLAANSLPDGAVVPGWGTLSNPRHGGSIQQEGNKLQMLLEPKMNDYNFSNTLAAPVTVNRVKGDFTQEVTVAPIHEANFFGEYLYFRNGNSHMYRFGPAWGGRALFDIHASGFNYGFYTPPHIFQADFKQPMRLRMRRVANLFYAAIKQGEQDWQEMAPFYLNCPEELEIGVNAINTSDRPLEAIFSDYQILPAK